MKRMFVGAVLVGVVLVPSGPAWAGCVDGDGDGYTASACGGADCNDTDDAISPSATEVCDGVDNDCDGIEDESDAADAHRWYVDADGDGFGAVVQVVNACASPAGHVDNGEDCDDTRPSVSPDAVELCNDIDDDCDGVIDDDASNASTFYADLDGDGYGNADVPVTSCDQPERFVGNSTDCDDADSTAWLDVQGLENSCDLGGSTDTSNESEGGKGGCSAVPVPLPLPLPLLPLWVGVGVGVGVVLRRRHPAV